MVNSDNIFIELLQISVGNRERLSCMPSDTEWDEIYETAKKQSLLGVLTEGLDKLPPEQKPYRPLLLRWLKNIDLIEDRNKSINNLCVALVNRFAEDGKKSCILKGQGVGCYYPKPLLRQCGDIDIWLEGDRKSIVRYIQSIKPDSKARFHHIDFDIVTEFEIEVHFFPTFFSSPFVQKRFMKWLDDIKEQQMNHFTRFYKEHEISTPTDELNTIFLLTHIYKHLIGEGIGFRQLMDYYFFLLHVKNDNDNYDKEEVDIKIKEFHLENFASAVMWVLQEVFLMDSKYLICPPNEKRGRRLLEEIMAAGNFGHYDTRVDKSDKSPLGFFCRKFRRGLSFIFDYPHEVLWIPYFNIYQRLWRKKEGLV